MKTGDFYRNLTSGKLNETFAKNFGGKVKLEKYTREQLEDIRNKLRTRVFQQENSAGYNDLLTNETYQKDQALLQLLNTRIKEMLGEDIKKLRDKMDQLSEAKKAKPDFLDIDKDGNKKEPMKKAAKDAKVKESAKPDFLDLDKDGNKTEPMKKAAQDKKMKEDDSDRKPAKEKEREVTLPSGAKVKARTVQGWQSQKADKSADKEKDLDEDSKPSAGLSKAKKSATVKKAKAGGDIGKPGKGFEKVAKKAAAKYGSKEKGEKVAAAAMWKNINRESVENFRHNVKFVNESLQFLLAEDEEGKAKAITAASDIVNDFTGWMQRVGQYQTKSMIELADSIKANFGAQEAEQFKQAVSASLSQTLETLTSQREAISNAVAALAGEATPEEPMGMEPGADAGMDMSEPDDMNPEVGGDEFGASDAAAGAGTTGREMRESREQRRARKLAESHSIISKLAR
jgi:hypothetical protein